MKTPKAKSVTGRRRGKTDDRISAGSKILAAIEEATELLRSEGLRSQQLTVRTYKVPSAPRLPSRRRQTRARTTRGESGRVGGVPRG